jgi:hypothetical protein
MAAATPAAVSEQGSAPPQTSASTKEEDRASECVEATIYLGDIQNWSSLEKRTSTGMFTASASDAGAPGPVIGDSTRGCRAGKPRKARAPMRAATAAMQSPAYSMGTASSISAWFGTAALPR